MQRKPRKLLSGSFILAAAFFAIPIAMFMYYPASFNILNFPGKKVGESMEMAEFLLGLDTNLALLLIEHDMDVVFDVADHISVLHFGEVLETGPTEQIRNSAKVQEIYFGAGA